MFNNILLNFYIYYYFCLYRTDVTIFLYLLNSCFIDSITIVQLVSSIRQVIKLLSS